MDTPLEKPSLVGYAYKNVRRGIEEGLWRDWLPGERKLCTQYRISRPTLRQVLRQLDSEGWIEIVHGKRTRILKSSRKADAQTERSVVFLSPKPLQELDPFAVFTIDVLRKFLLDSSVRFEVHPSTSIHQTTPGRRLERLVRETRADCWILYRTPRELQQWFMDYGVSSVIMGGTHPGIRVDSIDVDYRAACRHAVGILLARRHDPQRIALLIPKEKLAGHVESTIGFLEALEKKSRIPRARAEAAQDPRIAPLENQPARIARTLDRLLQRTVAPTAFIVQRPMHTLSVIGHLAHRHGFKIPDDASIMCLDDSPSMEYVIPTISRYAKKPDSFADKLFNLVMNNLEPGNAAKRQVMVMPDWIKGESVGPPREG